MAPVFEHLISSWWCCLVRQCSLDGGSTPLSLGFDSSLFFPTFFLSFLLGVSEDMISQLPVVATCSQPSQLPLWTLLLESWAKIDSSIHCLGHNVLSQQQNVANTDADREDSATLLWTLWILFPASFVRYSKKMTFPSNLEAWGSIFTDHTLVICWDLALGISPWP